MLMMMFNTFGLVYSLSLLLALMGGLKTGHIFGRRWRVSEQESEKVNTMDGVVFALLGLLLVFSFSGAMSSYGSHRDLLTKEAGAITDFYQKLDLLPENAKNSLQVGLREYANLRLEATQADIDSPVEREALAHSQRIQKQMWQELTEYVKESGNSTANNQLLNAFSMMTSAVDEQYADVYNHVPAVVYGLIFILAVMASLMAGYGMSNLKKLPITRIVIFSLAVCATVYTIIDLEFQRTGLFNASPTNTMLIKSIKDIQ